MIDWSLIIDESGLTGERTGSCGLEMLFVKHDCVYCKYLDMQVGQWYYTTFFKCLGPPGRANEQTDWNLNTFFFVFAFCIF